MTEEFNEKKEQNEQSEQSERETSANGTGFFGTLGHAAGSLGNAMEDVGQKLDRKIDDLGKKIEKKFTDPGLVEKSEQLKKQVGEAAEAAAGGLAKGATLVAEGAGKVIDSLKNAVNGLTNHEKQEQQPETNPRQEKDPNAKEQAGADSAARQDQEDEPNS